MHQELGYLEKIRREGFRVTPQRELILDMLCRTGGHVTAVEVCESVQSEMPAINQATVYRTLDFFCTLNIVAKTEIGGRTVYELVGDQPHHHLFCRHCHASIRFDADYLTPFAQQITAEYRFVPDLTHLVITGLCAECSHQ